MYIVTYILLTVKYYIVIIYHNIILINNSCTNCWKYKELNNHKYLKKYKTLDWDLQLQMLFTLTIR